MMLSVKLVANDNTHGNDSYNLIGLMMILVVAATIMA